MRCDMHVGPPLALTEVHADTLGMVGSSSRVGVRSDDSAYVDRADAIEIDERNHTVALSESACEKTMLNKRGRWRRSR